MHLIHYICIHEIDLLPKLLSREVNIEFETARRQRAIHLCCDNAPMLGMLLRRGANMEAEDANKNRPIHMVLFNRNYECFDLLCRYGANLEAQNKYHQRPIHIAIQMCNESIIKDFISKKINLEVEDNTKERPIHYICRYKLYLLPLLENVDFNAEDNRGLRPIDYICSSKEQQRIIINSLKILKSKGVVFDMKARRIAKDNNKETYDFLCSEMKHEYIVILICVVSIMIMFFEIKYKI